MFCSHWVLYNLLKTLDFDELQSYDSDDTNYQILGNHMTADHDCERVFDSLHYSAATRLLPIDLCILHKT